MFNVCNKQSNSSYLPVAQLGLFCLRNFRGGRLSCKRNPLFHFLKKRTGITVFEKNLLLPKFVARETVSHLLPIVEQMQVTTTQNLNYRYLLYLLMSHSANVLDMKKKSHTLEIITRIRYHLPVIYFNMLFLY